MTEQILPKPTGDFIIDKADKVGIDGHYYHYQTVCRLLEEYSNLQNQTIIAKYLGQQEHNAHLTGRIKELEAENARYRDRIGEALKFLQSRQQTTPGLGAPVTILKQALEK